MARSLARSVPRQGEAQWPAHIIIHHLFFFQLPKGTEYLKRPSLSRLFHPPITISIPLGHGESNRRCTLQVETRDVAALKALTCGFLRLPAIPGFNPAARSTTLLRYVSHGTRRGRGKVVSIFVCCCRLACLLACLLACMQHFLEAHCYAPLQHCHCHFHSTLPHL